jgi:hypothetical protein
VQLLWFKALNLTPRPVFPDAHVDLTERRHRCEDQSLMKDGAGCCPRPEKIAGIHMIQMNIIKTFFELCDLFFAAHRH